MRSTHLKPKAPRKTARTPGAAAPFISVAFVAGIFFVPLVIMTGLMTDPRANDESDLGLSTLRGTIDAQSLGLRPSQD